MKELDSERIEELSIEGNTFMDDALYEKAIQKFSKALDLVPAPKMEWGESLWLFASIGDAYFQLKKYKEAFENFMQAYKCPDGNSNPFVNLRIGQCYYELHDEKNAIEYLLRAYMIEGIEIFDEAKSYYDFLSSKVKLDK
ncbi:MAG TPA: hypothetical protein PK289_07220 [Bacteroidia bacterium]|nr:hypothetical protein [Bacteroidia bacterium]